MDRRVRSGPVDRLRGAGGFVAKHHAETADVDTKLTTKSHFELLSDKIREVEKIRV